VASPTQNQAKSALLFLYREVLALQLPWLDEIVGAKLARRLPVVLTPSEVRSLLAELHGTMGLLASLLYGTGMRLLEGLRLRVKDIEFERRELVVRDGKGAKDRVTVLPENLVLERLNLESRRPELRPVRRPEPPQAVRRLTDAEKQLIQALLSTGETVRPVLQPLVSQEFWREAWSWPVLEKLIEGSQGVDTVLNGMEGTAGMEDAALMGEIRAAALEASDSLTLEHVYASVQTLFDAHLSRKDRAIREELKKCGNEGAPVDLLKRLQEIQSERSRVANTLKARV